MRIDANRRYFRLKPEALARFAEYEAAHKEAVRAKIQAAEELLVKLGVPAGTVQVGLHARSYDVAFPAEVSSYAPGLFTNPDSDGYVRPKQNRVEGKRLHAKLDQYKVPGAGSFFPTLGVGRGWLVGWSWVESWLGRYGDEVVLIGIPKHPEPGEEYEPDLELIEELTLSDWAALVERTEQREGGGAP